MYQILEKVSLKTFVLAYIGAWMAVGVGAVWIVAHFGLNYW